MKVKHALLIDDNEVDNYITKAIITKTKVAEKITVKSSALEALEYLGKLIKNAEAFPDAIFLDIRMPEMDGFGFLEEFAKFTNEENQNTSIFMLTSSADPNDIKRAAQNQFVKKYLNKPLSESVLNRI